MSSMTTRIITSTLAATFVAPVLWAVEFGPAVAGARAQGARQAEVGGGAPIAAPEAHVANGPARLAASAGQPLAWSSLPFFGGEMTSIAVDPVDADTVYAGTRDAGVFKSTDGGRTWRPARGGLTFFPIRSLAVNPSRRTTVWAGTDNDGVWKSTDGGQTWRAAGGGSIPESMIVFRLVLDPGNPAVAYAACAGGVALSIGGVWKTIDGGDTWTRADAGIPRYHASATYTSGVFSFALDPSRPASLMAGTVIQGVYRSNDGGATWAPLNEGVPLRYGSTESLEEIGALAFDPHHGSRPAAIIDGRFYVYESSAWTQRSGTWDRLSFTSPDLAFHPILPDVVLNAGGFSGFTKSTDGGVTWSSNVPGIERLAVSPSSPNRLFGCYRGSEGSLGGVVRSVDTGDEWRGSQTGIVAADVLSITSDPTDPRHLYVGTGGGHVFASHDGGASWSFARDGRYDNQLITTFGGVRSIAVDPHDPALVSVAAFSGLFQSRDRGAKLFEVEEVLAPNAIAVTGATTPPTYYVGSATRGVYRSTDGGASWTAHSSGLPSFGSSLNPVLAIAIDPNDPRIVWIGTQYGGGILCSTDGGETWQQRGLTDENFVEAISVRPGDSRDILAGAGFFSGKIMRSIDGGVTWQTKLAEIGLVQDLVRDPANPDVVYAGSEGFGVLRSSDGGESWEDVTGDIFYPLVYSLAVTADNPPRLLAGSYGSGAYAAPLGTSTGRKVRRRLSR